MMNGSGDSKTMRILKMWLHYKKNQRLVPEEREFVESIQLLLHEKEILEKAANEARMAAKDLLKRLDQSIDYLNYFTDIMKPEFSKLESSYVIDLLEKYAQSAIKELRE